MTRFAKMDPRAILTPETRQRIPLPILHEFSRAIAYSVTHTLLWDLIPAGLAFVMLFWMGAARFRGMHHAEWMQTEACKEVDTPKRLTLVFHRERSSFPACKCLHLIHETRVGGLR